MRVVAVAGLGLGACASATMGPGPGVSGATGVPACASFAGFALSLASDRGGQRSPAAAAAWFAVHGGMARIPRGPWLTAGRPDAVYSGRTILHVVQGADGTWQVDSGKHCH